MAATCISGMYNSVFVTIPPRLRSRKMTKSSRVPDVEPRETHEMPETLLE